MNVKEIGGNGPWSGPIGEENGPTWRIYIPAFAILFLIIDSVSETTAVGFITIPPQKNMYSKNEKNLYPCFAWIWA